MTRPDRRGPSNCPVCRKVAEEQGLCPECRKLRNAGSALLRDAGYCEYQNATHASTEWIDGWANQLAVLFAEGRPGLAKHQLRAFYQQVKRLEAAHGAGRVFEATRLDVLELKPLAHMRRQRNKIPEEFRVFIERNCDAASEPGKFLRFVRHFESVTAYCEGRLKEGQ